MKPVNLPGFGSYHISDAGVVKNTRTNKILKNDINSAGYLRVTLHENGAKKRITVHRLVALTYLGDSDLVVNHKDGNKKNNHYSNLEWVTQSENRKHAFRHKLVRRPNSNLSDEAVIAICTCIENGMTKRGLLKVFNIPAHVYLDIRGRRHYKDISKDFNW